MFYLSNGKGEVDYGFALKAVKESNDKLVVIDELDKGGAFEVSKEGLIQINEEEYNKIINKNKNVNEGRGTTEEVLETIDKILKKYE